jgi:hypothetical protein
MTAATVPNFDQTALRILEDVIDAHVPPPQGFNAEPERLVAPMEVIEELRHLIKRLGLDCEHAEGSASWTFKGLGLEVSLEIKDTEIVVVAPRGKIPAELRWNPMEKRLEGKDVNEYVVTAPGHLRPRLTAVAGLAMSIKKALEPASQQRGTAGTS